MRINELLTESWLGDLLARFSSHNIKNYLKELKQEIENQIGQHSQNTEYMLRVYELYLKGAASEKQVKQANEQLLNLLKITGLSSVFIMPGGTFLLPLLVRLAKKVGINLLPKTINSI